MKRLIKRMIPKAFLDLRVKMKYNQDYQAWVKDGKPVPPPHIVKQKVIQEFQGFNHARCLVETGTFRGEMIEAQKKHFDTIYSIELGEKMYQNAVKRFQKDKNVTIVFGDSSTEIPRLVKKLHAPTVFWLDGHFSGGDTALGEEVSPVLKELGPIIDQMNSGVNHVILIDDAREFKGNNGYPSISEVEIYLNEKFSIPYTMEIKDDIIRISH